MQTNTSALLETIEVNPPTKPIASVIWLHGLGADGNDFVPIIPELKLAKDHPLRFVFPNAPTQPVTINNGYIMRAWYDIIAIDLNKHADEKGIANSVEHISRLIQNEEKLGMPSDRIILAGFSQGAVMALTTGLTYPKKLGGILALSGYLPYAETVMGNASIANQTVPIFIGHGTSDPVVPYFLGQQAQEILKQHHYNVEFHSYPIAHSVNLDEIHDIGKWFGEVL